MRARLGMLVVGLAVILVCSLVLPGVRNRTSRRIWTSMSVRSWRDRRRSRLGKTRVNLPRGGFCIGCKWYNYGRTTLDVAYGPKCSDSLGTVPAAPSPPPVAHTSRDFRLPILAIGQFQHYFCVRRVGKDSTWHRRVYESKFKDTPTTLRWDIRY